MNEARIERLQELDHLFRKLVRKFVKERDKITIDGISLPGLMIMRKVLYAGEQRLSDLAEELDLSSGAITAQCDKLEASGYAERTRYKEDRRTIYLNITEQGKAFLDRYHMVGQINIDVTFNDLSDDEVMQQLHIIRKLIANVEGMSEKIMTAIREYEDTSSGKRSSEQPIETAEAHNELTAKQANEQRKQDNPKNPESTLDQEDAEQFRAKEVQSQANEVQRKHYLSY